MHPVFKRLHLKFTKLVVKSSEIHRRTEREVIGPVWNIPANSLIIIVAGEVSIYGKTYRLGDICMPKVFEGNFARKIKVRPKRGTIILDLPFAKYALINAKWR